MTKLSTLIQLSKAFSAEVNVGQDFHYQLTDKNEKIDGYLPNASSRKIFREVLETLPTNTDRKAHLITASYGTGKSYLLLMLGHLLGNNRSAVLDQFKQKVTGKDDFYNDKLGQTLTNYLGNGDLYLIVIPNYADTDFNHALLQGLNEALRHESIAYIPATNYRRAAELLTRWKDEGSPNYTRFTDRLSNMTPDAFIRLLNNTDASSYQTFKQYFKDVIGVDFSESHADDAYGVYAETAKELLNPKYGYRGIVVLYDEFGTMLSNLINSPEGKGLAVQEFVEKVKRTGTGANILLLAASHQDPTTLREDKQRDVEKVVGRFERHFLNVTESEAEEILGTVFLHPDPTGLALLLNTDYIADATLRVQKHNLYPDKDDTWVTEKILKNLYPLHPLSAYLLPRLSGEFAQNTRSMFNFLSPVEKKEGALALFLDTTDTHTPDRQLNLFTPDRLLTFFEKNLAEAKVESVLNLTDSYRTAVRKLTDAPEIEQLYRVLLLLTVVGGRLQPKKDLLFWAMGWSAAKRTDFNNMLNDLVVGESLEFNPTTEVYEFPMSGSKSVSKIIQEEKQKLTGLSLYDCAAIWERIEPRPKIEPVNQEENFGANRHFRAVPAQRVIDLTGPIDILIKYYRGTLEEYAGNGLVFYLLAPTEADLKPMLDVLKQPGLTQPYTFYAVPKDGTVFESAQERTLEYWALEETLNREEVKANSNQQHGVREQLRTAKARLQQTIKDLYQPSGWLWYYAAESTPHEEFKSTAGFLNWFDTKVDELFTIGSVPVVKEDVLWFKEAEKPARSKALAMLWDADKDGLHLSSSATTKPPQNRILENLFRNLRLTKDGKTVSGIMYGDVKTPESNTAAAAIFRHIDKTLKTGGPRTDPTDMLAGLLQAPFGLSRPLTLFMLTAYARANRDELIVSDPKRDQSYILETELFEKLVRKPQEYRMRRIDMPGPHKRYLDKLRTLFDNQTATSFGEIGRQMTGLVKFLSPLQRTLIQQEKGTRITAFYESLDAFAEKTAGAGTNQDAEASEYLLEVLPDNLLGMTRTEFENAETADIERLIALLKEFKEFPIKKEREFRLDTLTLMADAVFGEILVGKEDIRKITEGWFGKLPPAKRQATYEEPKVNEWLGVIRNGPGRKDLFDVYLADLTVHPDKDWTGNLMQCQSQYVDEFKAYKKVVEEYTQSPLPVYQAIARVVFAVPATECPDETTFASLFSKWYNGLSNQAKAYPFDDRGLRILLDNIDSGLSTKQRFLEVIPTRWKDVEKLPAYIPANWEDWSAMQQRAVAEEYERCCRIVNTWKPAVSEADYFTQIGQVFELNDTVSAEALRQALTSQWLPALPERTRTAPWVGMGTIEAQFMAHLTNGNFYDFTTCTLPLHYGLPTLQTMDEDTLLFAFTRKVEGVRLRVEAYRRPLEELIGVLAKKQYDTVAEYQNTLYATIRATEAFTNAAEKDDTLPLDDIPRLLLKEVRLNRPFDDVVALLAEQLNLPADHHVWSRDEQLQFVRSTNEYLKALQTWRFPEDRRMADAKTELSPLIWKMCQNYGLSVGQMRKIVNDIFGEQSPNGHA